MQRALQLARQLLESRRIDLPPLTVRRPVRLAHRVQRETHPSHLIGLRAAALALHALGVSFRDDLVVDANRILLGVGISELANRETRNSFRAVVVSDPLMDHLRKANILADDDEHRWPRVVSLLAPLVEIFAPVSGKHGDRLECVLEDSLRLEA